MPGKIQLILPGLFDLPLSEFEPGFLSGRLPGLNRILRLATARPNNAFTIDALLRRALALPEDAHQPATCLPLAQAYAAPEARQRQRLLLFRAVHLRPDLHSAVIVPIPPNQENLNELILIIKDLKDLFKVDCDINALPDGLFLMVLKEIDAPTHYPHILSVLGKPANPYIEQSRVNLRWYKLLNEMQMFLHQHSLNQRRLDRGLLPINSLWFWGGGHLPEYIGNPCKWYCSDPLLGDFATSLGLVTGSLDELANLAGSTSATVIDLRLIEMMKTGLASTPDQLLIDIENRILKPLLATVERDRSRLLLCAGYEYDFEMTPLSGLKFWRRNQSLETWSGRGQVV